MAFVSHKSLPDLSKLDPLNGTNYKRWSQKLLMFFEQLDIDYVLFNDPHITITLSGVEVTDTIALIVSQNEQSIKKHDKDNKTARCHILNHMTNTLFDLFMVHKSAKIIWESLEN